VNALQPQLPEIRFVFAVVHPRCHKSNTNPLSARWSFPIDLTPHNVSNAPTYSLSEAKKILKSMDVDACVTHMYDKVGTEVYRLLLDELNISFVGSSAETMKISNNKQSARRRVAKYGVAVPKGVSVTSSMNIHKIRSLLQQHQVTLPVVVKPCVQDNSLGITLVQRSEELEKAVLEAFEYDSQIVIEQYIPLGRELRIGVVETGQDSGQDLGQDFGQNGKEKNLMVLPCIEYHLSSQHPIRTNLDKFTKNAKAHSTAMKSTVNCPVDSTLKRKLETLAKRAHVALKCRDFSLFDIRVDPEGTPYFIESNLYWSFSSKSIVTLMAESTNNPKLSHSELFKSMVERVAKRTRNMRTRNRSKL